MAFQPDHILPFDSIDSSTSTQTNGPSIAICGSLPVSSLLHIALNHLRVINSRPALEEGEEEKDSIEKGNVLILSSDRDAWRNALVAENNAGLLSQGKSSGVLKLLDRIQFKFLPTSAHLKYFLATAYTWENHVRSHAAWKNLGSKAKTDPSYLGEVPTLVVLHNPAGYLEEEAYNESGVEAYASLVALFVSTFSSMSCSEGQPQLVLLEEQATGIELPVIPPSRIKKSSRPTETNRTSLDRILTRFFSSVYNIQPVPRSPSAVTDEGMRTFSMIHQASGENQVAKQVLELYVQQSEEDGSMEIGRSW